MCSPLRASTAMRAMWRSPGTGRASRFATAATTSPINRCLSERSRASAKDMATDYGEADSIQAFAERRGITFGERDRRDRPRGTQDGARHVRRLAPGDDAAGARRGHLRSGAFLRSPRPSAASSPVSAPRPPASIQKERIGLERGRAGPRRKGGNPRRRRRRSAPSRATPAPSRTSGRCKTRSCRSCLISAANSIGRARR